MVVASKGPGTLSKSTVLLAEMMCPFEPMKPKLEKPFESVVLGTAALRVL